MLPHVLYIFVGLLFFMEMCTFGRVFGIKRQTKILRFSQGLSSEVAASTNYLGFLVSLKWTRGPYRCHQRWRP